MFHAENRTVVLHVCIKMYQKRQKFPVNALHLSYLIPFFLTTPPGKIKNCQTAVFYFAQEGEGWVRVPGA